MRHIVVEAKTELEAKVKAGQALRVDEVVNDIYRIQNDRWHVTIVKDLEELNR